MRRHIGAHCKRQHVTGSNHIYPNISDSINSDRPAVTIGEQSDDCVNLTNIKGLYNVLYGPRREKTYLR